MKNNFEDISRVLFIPSRYLAGNTNLDRRRIAVKPGFVKTEYFAKKKAAIIAARCFSAFPEWSDVLIKVRYEGGEVLLDISPGDFSEFWGLPEEAFRDPIVLSNKFFNKKIHKDQFLIFADRYIKNKSSSFAPSGSALGRFLDKIKRSTK